MISFPFGADIAEVKAAAAERALVDGADDLEVMMGLQRFLSGGGERDARRAGRDRARRRACGRSRTGAGRRRCGPWSRRRTSTTAASAWPPASSTRPASTWCVTSSGLGPRSTSVLDVELLREELGGAIAIKAAGGIRTHGEAVELIAAGANRVGATQIAPLLETWPPVKIDDVPVDAVGVADRVAWLAKRSIKTTAKAEGLRLALSMIDLTTLEGKDSDGKVRRLCAKALAARPVRPDAAAVRRRLRLPAFVAARRRS